MTERPNAEPRLEGAPEDIAALLAVEARLGVTFCDAYRSFVADPKRHRIGVKHVRFRAVSKVDWVDDKREYVAIGSSRGEHPATLVFKRGRSARLSEAVYELVGGRARRRPDFSELIITEHVFRQPLKNANMKLAERLAGGARICPRCGKEIRIGQLHPCGHVGAVADPLYRLSAEQLDEARTARPLLIRAWELVAALKESGHAVPSGPTQLLAIEQVLTVAPQGKRAAAIVETWAQTGMNLTVDVAAVEELLGDA